MSTPEIVPTTTPTPDDLLVEAEAAVRAYCGWHITPVRTDTVTVWSDGGPVLLLPSLKVQSVASVTRNGTDIGDWDVRENGVLYRRWWWPLGAIVVTFTHGYDSAPELNPIIRDVAERAAASGPYTQVGQVRVGADHVTGLPVGGKLTSAELAVIDRYRLTRRP